MKRIFSLLMIVVLIAALAIVATGCNGSTTDNTSTGKYSDIIPGGESGVSQEVLEALVQSGTVTTYFFEGEGNDIGVNNKEFKNIFREVYGGEIMIDYIEWEGWEQTFIADFAANEAPDLIHGFAKLWPKIANRGMVFSRKELAEKGVVGLDHPVLMDHFETVEKNFTYKNEPYGFSLLNSACFWCIVNEDLYAQYNVKSPSKYYQEGLWNMETLAESSRALITAAGLNDSGTREIYGYYCWDSTVFIRANGQQLVGYDPKTGKLVNNIEKKEVVDSLENLRTAFQEQYATNRDSFTRGKIGVIALVDGNIAQTIPKITFKWSIIPFPVGRSNDGRQMPGSVQAWMVTSSAKNLQGAVNLVIALNAAKKANILPEEPNSIKVALKDHPEILEMMEDSRYNGVNDNMYGVGSLWNNQWDFWSAIRFAKGSVTETIQTYKPMFDAQIETEMENAE